MEFEKFRQLRHEDPNYNPMIFEDEITGDISGSVASASATPAAPETSPASDPSQPPAQAKSQMGSLIAEYFEKGQDPIDSLDGFANDFANELANYLQEEWINPEDFTGRDDALADFKKAVKNITDARLVKIATAIHDVGNQLANAKNNARKKNPSA